MTAPAVLWPVLLGLSILVAGIVTYRQDLGTEISRRGLVLAVFGPVFVASGLAAFAGEHFTLAPSLAQLVPKWLPARLFIAYFVGVAHLAAALSFVARRYVRWSSVCLAVMFALFVLLMDLPGALRAPGVRISWSLAARETTYAIGALALFATAMRADAPGRAKTIATVARFWTAAVLVFYGVENLLFPQFSSGVPDVVPVAAWVPAPTVVADVAGLVLVVSGLAMLIDRYASRGAALAGWLLLVLTVALFVPQFFLARNTDQFVTAINFVFDTLLFAGTVLVISRAIVETTSTPNN